MNSEHRSAISVVFVLLLAGTMTAVALAPQPQAEPMQTDNATSSTTGQTTIAVSATGEAQAEPDLAVLHIESSATAPDPENATDRLAANASQLRQALLQAGVTEDQIRTTDYNLYDESERGDPQRAPNETRYVAQQGFAIEVENTSRAGELLDVAVANGATGVRHVEFTLSDATHEELRTRALEAAMSSARTEAETLAATEELQITGVDSISTDARDPRPFATGDAAAFEEAETQIDSGPVAVHATVQVTYNATG